MQCAGLWLRDSLDRKLEWHRMKRPRISMTLEPQSDSKALRQQPTRAVSNHTTGRANLQQEAAFNGSIHACACLWCPHSPHNMSALTNGRETQTERERERQRERGRGEGEAKQHVPDALMARFDGRSGRGLAGMDS